MSERELEAPFCQLLTHLGYSVIHVARHAGSELGKDIVAMAPDRRPWAFQVKCPGRRRVTLSAWRKGLGAQVTDLVEVPIQHPNLPKFRAHKPCLVINAEPDNEVYQCIDQLNRRWACTPGETLDVWNRAALLERFVHLGDDLWPADLHDTRCLLQVYTADGHDFLPKDLFAELVQPMLLDRMPRGTAARTRRIAGAGVIVGCALGSFTTAGNHLAQIEGWGMYAAAVTAAAARGRLNGRCWVHALQTAELAISYALAGMLRDMRCSENLAVEPVWLDGPFHWPRLTLLAGMAALWTLWPREQRADAADDSEELTDFAAAFLTEHRDLTEFWGEGAAPFWLAHYWALRTLRSEQDAGPLLKALLAIASRPARSCLALASPYVSVAELMDRRIQAAQSDRPPDTVDLLPEQSYVLDSAVQLAARAGRLDLLEPRWADITRVVQYEFVPPDPWMRLLWRSRTGGVAHRRIGPGPHSWQELRQWALTPSYDWVPLPLRDRPHLVLLFLMVYPHRLCADLMKLADDAFGDRREVG